MPDPRTFMWIDAEFRVADKIGLMPLMRFAKVAKSGVDSNEIEGLAAMYDLLRACIHPEDWARFEEHADRQAADNDQLLEVVGTVMRVVSERPTGRPSESSDGPSANEPESTVSFLRRASVGRPDLEAGLIEAAQHRGQIPDTA